MKKFRKVWTEEINAWLKTTKGMTPGDAYALFLKTYPDIKDVTRTAFCNQRSRMGAAGPSYNPKFSRAIRPLYSEQIKKGYVRIKIAQPNVWVSKAKWVYMETHPEEYEICSTTRANYIFLDGNTRNFHPDNIARVPLNIISVFNALGGTVDGKPELTRLRLTQAILKSKTLDKMEKCGKVNKYATYRSDKQRAHERYLKQKSKPGYKEHQREVAREYIRRLKVERPEKYAEILRRNNELRRKKYKKNKNI